MSTLNFNRIMQAARGAWRGSGVLFFLALAWTAALNLQPASAQANDSAAAQAPRFTPTGSIVSGQTQIALLKNGLIKLSNSRGDSYDIHLSLTRANDGQWFTASQLDNKEVTIDEPNKVAKFRGSFTLPGQEPVGVEYSLALVNGKARISLRYLSDAPIKNFLSLANIHVHSARGDMVGHEIRADAQVYKVEATTPTERQSKPMFTAGKIESITYFPEDAERRLVFRTVHAAMVAGYDYNVTAAAPYVQLRYLPQDNQISFDVELPQSTLAASTATSDESYGGVDYYASGNLRLPRYGLNKNLVQNPGFEQGLHFWHFGPLGRITNSRLRDYHLIDEQNAFKGRRALKILGEQGQSPAHAASLAIPVEAGQQYTASFYAKADRPAVALDTQFTTGVWTVFPVQKKVPLTTEWKRYEFSFKAPNNVVSLDFGVDNPQEDCAVWVDAVQLERGALTEYSEKPAAVTLYTARRDNLFQPGEKVDARLEVIGPPSASTQLTLKLTDFFGRVVREDNRSATLSAQGLATIPVPWAENLPSGLYLLETHLRTANGFVDRSFDRVAVMRFADNTARHKNIFAFGGSDPRRGDWYRKFEFFKKAGIGSGVLFDPPGHSYLSLLAQNGLLDVTSIFHGGEKLGEWNVKTDYAQRSESDLKAIEEKAFQLALEYPEIAYWKTVNEPLMSSAASVDEMKLFIRPVQAAYRGIKRANPKALVFSPDPANMSPQGGIRWLDVFLQAGGKAACDIIAIHPYRTRPEEPDLDADTKALFSMLARHGYQGEVWFTEGVGHFYMHLPALGINVHKALSQEEGGGWRAGHLTYDLSQGERISAAYSMRSWLVALKYSDRVKQFVDWYFPINSTLDLDMTPGATIFASNTLVHLLGNAIFRQDIALGENTRGYLFEDGQKRPVVALWTHDIKVDKGETQGPRIDISGLPAGVELIDFTGNVVPRTPELQLTSFPIFLRGSAGSQSTLATALSRVPVRSGSARQVLPFLEVTGTNKVELRMHNLLSRPAAGRLQVRRDAQTLYDKNITVNGTTTWSLPIELSRDSQPIQQQIQQQKVNVQFQPEAGAPAQISNLQVEVLSASRRVQPISVDGDLSDWPSQSAMTLPRRVVDFSAKAAPYGGDADLSGRLHAAWDKEHLYLAMEIQDDVFEAASSARMSWQGDGVQLYFDSWQNARGTTQQGYNGDDQVYDLWPGPNGVELHRAVAPEKQIGFTEPGIVANVQAATKRTATGYTLELAIPTRELAPINFQAGSTFGFALIVNDKDDATGRKRGLTLTPEGTEPHMRPDLYPVMVLKP